MTNRHQAGIPAGAEIVELLQARVERWYQEGPEVDWEAAQPRVARRSDGSLIDEIEYLGSINCFQWHLEDECRASYDDLAWLGTIKRRIDASNNRRVHTIDVIDERVSAIVSQRAVAARSGRLALTTPGAVVDRLSVLELRFANLRTADDGDDLAMSTREQIESIALGFDLLIDDLMDGRQRLHVYRTIKIYS